MKTTVANDADAIGYISLGSLDDTVKAVKIDGAEAAVENVKSGSYKVSRPFNVVTNSGKELSPVAQDFMKFVLSSDGQNRGISRWTLLVPMLPVVFPVKSPSLVLLLL